LTWLFRGTKPSSNDDAAESDSDDRACLFQVRSLPQFECQIQNKNEIYDPDMYAIKLASKKALQFSSFGDRQLEKYPRIDRGTINKYVNDGLKAPQKSEPMVVKYMELSFTVKLAPDVCLAVSDVRLTARRIEKIRYTIMPMIDISRYTGCDGK
jgi:hypothetical protein